MITRKQYLDATRAEGPAMHRAYYGQFVTEGIKSRVLNHFGLAEILASEDPSFNDIALQRWDNVLNWNGLPAETAKLLRAMGDYPTMAGAVCIAKEAARQIKEEHAA